MSERISTSDIADSTMQINPDLKREEFLTLRKRRNSVSAESYDPRTGSSIAIKAIPKSPEEWSRLNQLAEKNLFLREIASSLETKNLILGAMFEIEIEPQEEVITQGDLGDNFYVIEKGSFEVLIDGKLIITLHDGQSFGELALMYNQPRAATILSKSNGILWAIDGQTFRKVIIDIAYKKRTLYENMLSGTPLFNQLSRSEICRIAEAVSPITYQSGDTIVKQGDIGEEFFIIADGQVQVSQSQKDHDHKKQSHIDKQEKIIKILKEGDYFGELALLNKDSKRTATVKALSKVLCLTLSRADFIRLLGSVIKLQSNQ